MEHYMCCVVYSFFVFNIYYYYYIRGGGHEVLPQQLPLILCCFFFFSIGNRPNNYPQVYIGYISHQRFIFGLCNYFEPSRSRPWEIEGQTERKKKQRNRLSLVCARSCTSVYDGLVSHHMQSTAPPEHDRFLAGCISKTWRSCCCCCCWWWWWCSSSNSTIAIMRWDRHTERERETDRQV